jgi:hypothetical protein
MDAAVVTQEESVRLLHSLLPNWRLQLLILIQGHIIIIFPIHAHIFVLHLKVAVVSVLLLVVLLIHVETLLAAACIQVLVIQEIRLQSSFPRRRLLFVVTTLLGTLKLLLSHQTCNRQQSTLSIDPATQGADHAVDVVLRE